MDNNTLLETNSFNSPIPVPPSPVQPPQQPQDQQPRPQGGRRWIATLLLVLIVFALGYGAGQGSFALEDGRLVVNRAYDSQKADYSLFWDAYDLLNTKFVDQPLDQQKLLHGAISGLISAAGDPYTTFFDPEHAQIFAQELEGSFDGIGAEVGMKEEQMIIVAALDDTPAQRGGLLPGDSLLAINGESTSGMSLDQAVSRIRGKAGTEVKVTILHEGTSDSNEITLIRAKIEVPSLKYESREIDGKKIGIIRMARFGEDTDGLLSHAVDVILQTGVKGIVLDLRGNPGGYLDTAITTASNWVDTDKLVVKERAFNGEVKDYVSESWPRLKGIETVVLINEGSASASEIVAGALKDYGLATLVGQKTYGKGSVQELTDMKDSSTIKITIAKWYTPNDVSIDKNGLEPDVAVERTRDDFLADRDPQLDKALELLK